MKALVIYDSIFGNTEKIARSIGSALGPQGEVEVVQVINVKPEQLAGLDLLVVGSPTRAFRPTEATKIFLKNLAGGSLQGVRVAAFDTRMNVSQAPAILKVMANLFGYAAKPIADRLKNRGGNLVAEPEGFVVKATEGPLAEGELERSAAWASKLC